MSGDEDDNLSYGNVHRAFLQALLARKSLTLEEAKPLIAQIESAANPERPTLAEDVTLADLDNYIHTLNSQISFFDFEIRSTQHQIKKTRIYALVNTTSDALTQMATTHTADEIAYVKRVLDAMFETYNTHSREVMAIKPNQALQLAKPAGVSTRRESGTQAQSQNAGLTMAQAEKMMRDMVSEGWFDLNNEFYTLSPRALMELRGWLVDTYNTPDDEKDDDEEELPQAIKMCEGCKEIVTMGQRCPQLDCQARVHNHCKAGMFRIHGGREQCPKCKTAWVDALPVGVMAARGARVSNVNGNGRQRSNGMGMDGADDEDESDAVSGA
jgi:non-structural maintenance of chromosomes element 1